jgi:tyrosyl-tRNA synthetase
MDSEAATQERRLLTGVVEALPEGRLAAQLEGGRRLRIKLGIDPTAPTFTSGTWLCSTSSAFRTRATWSS